jgi:hypothetical protein
MFTCGTDGNYFPYLFEKVFCMFVTFFSRKERRRTAHPYIKVEGIGGPERTQIQRTLMEARSRHTQNYP